MPQANNGTGAGTGDNYSPQNMAMVAGILTPTDGDVYVYGYDENNQQVIIQKLPKMAEVPHRGMLPHPVFANNLLDSYNKQAVIPTVNDYLSTYNKQAVVPTTTNNSRGSFTQTNAEGESTTYSNLLEPTVRRLTALQDNPVLGSHTHALYSPYQGGQERGEATFTFSKDGGQSVTYTNALQPTILKATNLEDNPILYSHTHALHSAYIAGQVRGAATFTYSKDGIQSVTYSDALQPTILRAEKLAENPILNSHTHALHSAYRGGFLRESVDYTLASGATVTSPYALEPTVRRINALKLNPVLGSHTHALHGKAGTQQLSYAWENPERFRQQLANMSANTPSGALHGVTKNMLLGYTKNPVTPTVNDFLTPYNAAKAAAANSGIKTGALHGRAGSSGTGGGLISGLAGKMMDMLFGGSTWPMTGYFFYVLVGGTELGFRAIDGLEAEIGVIEYRDGNAPFFGKERMPGLVNYSRVTMKKGVFAHDTNSNRWFAEIAQNRNYTKRRTIVIAMMDHNFIPQFIWRFEKAFLTKVTPPNLDAEADGEVAIEEMEFIGRAWYMETLIMKGAAAAGAIAGAAGVSLNSVF